MKRAYELALVLRMESGGDEGINEQISTVQTWVEAEELGQVTRIDRWGRRRLAYEIDNQKDGYYVIMEASINPSGLPEIERSLKLSGAILRYLIVRSDEN
ncbi:MAG: 30S ribosomal protein S6 [Anaerolineaceae bacterium]|nr:30S ribosomal protein S6 [Anaerolineaceae bacterium]MCY3906661.1 30S ribosomal protein S6 [Anaerolineaceae bacterium]MCY3946698.1 30S ribosomal protein S6 [Anaerolineaceae bacterium]MCY4022989.1 30S ribosomal protein S6 [Anaerolineaceae bacterium]MDD9956409.1 30S ribosomal protein S6 [Anaerolineaceae bacterium]